MHIYNKLWNPKSDYYNGAPDCPSLINESRISWFKKYMTEENILII